MHLSRKRTAKIINRNTAYSDTPKGQLKHTSNKARRREDKAESRN